MKRFFKLLVILVCLCSCSTNTEKIIAELYSEYNNKFECIGNSGNEYFFYNNNFSGEPFTDNFSAYSQIISYEINGNDYRRTIDTIFYSSNNYSDIKLDVENLKFNIDSLKFIFLQCPDGKDECVKDTLMLPSLGHCLNCR